MNRFTFLCSLVTIVVATSIATMDAQAQDVRKASKAVIPVFSLNHPILESPTAQDPFFGSVGAESLKDLVARLEQARDDDAVPAIIILLGNASMGSGQLEELHKMLREIRDTGKPVYAHADSLSFTQLALLSATSRISVAPVGDLFITGLYGAQPHLRGLLDKIHVTPDYITSGEYKSAGEMFMRSEPSPEADEMYGWLYDGIFDTYIGLIADGRGESDEQIRKWVDQGLYSAEKAAKLGIIDAAEYRADFLQTIRQEHGDDLEFAKRYGKKKSNTLDLSNPFGLFKVWADLLSGTAKPKTKKSVAIVYVDGAIMTGNPVPSPFGIQGIAFSDPIRKALDKAAADDSVKGVVLRVNSPGGSAVASEIILQATRRLAAKKPFVVSMGDVAGSGGYYVSCGADTIFADAGTITASIGVVAGKLATDGMWDAVGINWHPIQRGRNAGMLYSGQVFTEEQKQNLQDWMNEVYEVFKGHVVKARGDRLTKPIDDIAGGRVFTGRQALELGLVDRIGTLRDAVQFVAEKAEVDDYDVRVIPKPKSLLELMFADMMGTREDDDAIHMASRLGRGRTQSLWEAVAPILNRLEPRRAASIRRALMQLEVLQRERLSLTMPEIVFGG